MILQWKSIIYILKLNIISECDDNLTFQKCRIFLFGNDDSFINFVNELSNCNLSERVISIGLLEFCLIPICNWLNYDLLLIKGLNSYFANSISNLSSEYSKYFMDKLWNNMILNKNKLSKLFKDLHKIFKDKNTIMKHVLNFIRNIDFKLISYRVIETTLTKLINLNEKEYFKIYFILDLKILNKKVNIDKGEKFLLEYQKIDKNSKDIHVYYTF